MRQQRAALVAELLETLTALRARIRLEILEGGSQRAPFQFGDAGIIDIGALAQPRQRFAIGGSSIFRDRLDVDVERVQEHPAVRRIGAAIGRPVVEQRMERIEADTIGAQLARKLDQASQIGEVAHAPVARRAHAVELHGDQPGAVEITGIGLRRHDQRHVLALGAGVHQAQTMHAHRQGLRPVDAATIRPALADDPAAGHDRPADRQFGSSRHLCVRSLTWPDHYRPNHNAALVARRQRIDDDFERGLVGHTSLTLAVDKLGENSEITGLAVEVHSARGLHGAGAGHRGIVLIRKEDRRVNAPHPVSVPRGNNCRASGIL